MDSLFDVPAGMQDEVSDAARILRTFVSKVSAESGAEVDEIFSKPDLPQPGPMVALEQQASASFDSLQSGRSVLPDRPGSVATNMLSGDDLVLEDVGGDLPLLSPLEEEAGGTPEPTPEPIIEQFSPPPAQEPTPAPPTTTRRSTRSRTFTFEAPVLVEDIEEPHSEPVRLEPEVRKTPPPPPMAPILEKKGPPPPPSQSHISAPPPSPVAPSPGASRDDFSIDDWYSSAHQPALGSESDVLDDYWKEQQDAKQQFMKTLVIVLPSIVLFAAAVFFGVEMMTDKKKKPKAENRKAPVARKVVKRTPPKVTPRKVAVAPAPAATPDGAPAKDAGTAAKPTGAVTPADAAAKKDGADAAEKKAAADAAAKKAAADAAAKKAAADAAAKKAAADAAAKKKAAARRSSAKRAAARRAARRAAAKRAAARRAAARRTAARRAAAKRAAARRAAAKRAAAKKKRRSTRVSAASKAASTRLYNKGLKLFFSNKVVPAQGYLVRSIRANPRNANSYRVLGLIYFRLGKKKLAKRAFKKFLRLQPSGPLANQIRALLKNL